MKTKLSDFRSELLFFAFVFLTFTPVMAQHGCAEGEIGITIGIVPDNWPNETSWELVFEGELIAEGTSGAYFLRLTGNNNSPFTGRFDIK